MRGLRKFKKGFFVCLKMSKYPLFCVSIRVKPLHWIIDFGQFQQNFLCFLNLDAGGHFPQFIGLWRLISYFYHSLVVFLHFQQVFIKRVFDKVVGYFYFVVEHYDEIEDHMRKELLEEISIHRQKLLGNFQHGLVDINKFPDFMQVKRVHVLFLFFSVVEFPPKQLMQVHGVRFQEMDAKELILVLDGEERLLPFQRLFWLYFGIGFCFFRILTQPKRLIILILYNILGHRLRFGFHPERCHFMGVNFFLPRRNVLSIRFRVKTFVSIPFLTILLVQIFDKI